jgi:hypothetical protein
VLTDEERWEHGECDDIGSRTAGGIKDGRWDEGDMMEFGVYTGSLPTQAFFLRFLHIVAKFGTL